MTEEKRVEDLLKARKVLVQYINQLGEVDEMSDEQHEYWNAFQLVFAYLCSYFPDFNKTSFDGSRGW